MRTNKINNDIVVSFRNCLNSKHRLIFDLGYALGLRISDIIKLKISILDTEKPTIKEQKTGKSKRIYIPKKLRQQMKELHAATSCNDFIFYSATSNTGHISRQAVFKAFKKASKKLGISDNIATQSMRKSYACKLFEKGKGYKYIQTKLNHTPECDTLLYLFDEFKKE